MVLVTTAIDDYSELGDSILLLGEWCKSNSVSSKYQKKIDKTLEYHWVDRKKFAKDQNTIIKLYENLLPKYSKSLNLIHKVNYSENFWRILIGPWLLFFISTLFDRWCSMLQATNQDLDFIALSIVNKEKMTSINMEDFYNKSLEDEWNNYIFSRIVKKYTSIEFREFFLIKEASKNDFPRVKPKIKDFFKKTLQKLTSPSLGNDVVFVDSYMPILFQWKLEKLLRQKKSFFQFNFNLRPKFRELDRDKLKINYSPKNDFEEFIISMIPCQIPQSYFEHFDSFLNNAKDKKYPQSPKIIFTSNAHFFNDQFKFWASMNKELGSKLVIGQHGGGIGSMKVVLSEYMEKSSADKYITWGWDDANFHNIVQLPAQKLLQRKKYSPKNSLLHVMDDNPRYSRLISSTPISSLHLDYLEDQYLISNQINHNLIKSYFVRRCPNNYKWDTKEAWNKNVLFDKNKHFLKSINEHKLILISSNSTTLLQVLSANIPTVIFLNPKYNEFREESKNDFEVLKKVGIFFDSSELAAKHINSIWTNVLGWWENAELQKARNHFCFKYARTNSNALLDWKSFIENLKND